MLRSLPLTETNAFYALITGQFISTTGSAITRFGLSVWVFSQTSSASAYTLLVFFATASVGFGALVAGPLVDRWDRRRVILISDAIASLCTLFIAVFYFIGGLELWHIYVAVCINGIASAFSRPAIDASIPLLVKKDKLTQASSLSQITGSLEMILSAAIGGFIVGAFGLGLVFIIDFLTFAVNIMLIMLTVIPQPVRKATGHSMHNIWHDFVVGLSYIRQRPPLLYLLGLFSMTMFFLPGVAYSLVTPLVLTFASEQELGLIMSGFGIGSLVGGLLMAFWGNTRHRMHRILIGMMVAGLAAILISLREDTRLISVGFFITGVSFVFIMGLSRVIWQMKTAPEMLGRVFSLQLALGVGVQSAGALVAGVLADRVFEPLLMHGGAWVNSVGMLIGTGVGRGMAFMFLLMGTIQLLIALFFFIMPFVRRLEEHLPDAEIVALPADATPQSIQSIPG